MRSDRPLIVSVLLLASGLALIFGYCNGTAGFSAALPASGASLHVAFTTIGPAAMGGVVLTLLGLISLAWALICAIVGQFQMISSPERVADLPREWIPKS